MEIRGHIRTLYEDGSLEVLPAATFFDTVQAAIVLAAQQRMQITFTFNNVHVTVEGDSNAELIYRDYVRAICGNTDKNIGPHPAPTLSDEEVASDERRRAERIGAAR